MSDLDFNGRPVGTRTLDLYRVKAALLCTANNFDGIEGRLGRVSTPKPRLLQVKLQVKKFAWNPSSAIGTAQGLPSKHNVDSGKQ